MMREVPFTEFFKICIIGILVSGCDLIQKPPLMTFEAHVYYSGVDDLIKNEWGDNIDVSIEFPRSRIIDSSGDRLEKINLKREGGSTGSVIFTGGLFGSIDSSAQDEISFSWVINNVRTKHIFKQNSPITKESTIKKILKIDVTEVIFADHSWKKSGTVIRHKIAISNISGYSVDSLNFSFSYYSKDNTLLGMKNRVYRKPIAPGQIGLLSLSVGRIDGLEEAKSTNPHLSKIYYSKK
ncbi:MAG: hypothetical protein IID12_08555 [Candidatus Marinimicrobia bacterium]|nr:hypothetical protein [Candidatus Neomarinimicrobiota bacterium]